MGDKSPESVCLVCLSVCLSVYSNGHMDSNLEKQDKNSKDWNANSILEAVIAFCAQLLKWS